MFQDNNSIARSPGNGKKSAIEKAVPRTAEAEIWGCARTGRRRPQAFPQRGKVAAAGSPARRLTDEGEGKTIADGCSVDYLPHLSASLTSSPTGGGTGLDAPAFAAGMICRPPDCRSRRIGERATAWAQGSPAIGLPQSQRHAAATAPSGREPTDSLIEGGVIRRVRPLDDGGGVPLLIAPHCQDSPLPGKTGQHLIRRPLRGGAGKALIRGSGFPSQGEAVSAAD